MNANAARQAIEAVVARQDAAWNAGDAAGFSADARGDVVFTNIIGMFSVGRAPFEAQHERIFATIYKGSKLSRAIVNIAFLRCDIAIVDTLATLSGFAHLPPGIEAEEGVLHTRLEQVMACDDGAWRVASFHNVPVNSRALAGVPLSPE